MSATWNFLKREIEILPHSSGPMAKMPKQVQKIRSSSHIYMYDFLVPGYECVKLTWNLLRLGRRILQILWMFCYEWFDCQRCTKILGNLWWVQLKFSDSEKKFCSNSSGPTAKMPKQVQKIRSSSHIYVPDFLLPGYRCVKHTWNL